MNREGPLLTSVPDRNALIAEHIGPFYVYLLVDPRSGLPFYVGKGSGERFRSHGIEAELAGAPGESSGESSAERRQKVDRIQAIREAGLEPEVIFARIGLTESEAFLLEATLIDTLGAYRSPLENLVRGQGAVAGLVSLAEPTGRSFPHYIATGYPHQAVRLEGRS